MENTQSPVAIKNPIKENPIPGLVKKFPKFNFKALLPYIIGVVLVVLAGVGTGWLVSGGLKSLKGTSTVPGAKTTASSAGLSDTSTFKDTAEGVLQEGGISGEGTHHLVRPGGDTQSVYLTSTVVDLQSFVGKKVEVWGQTVTAKTATWLMDVGKIQVIQ